MKENKNYNLLEKRFIKNLKSYAYLIEHVKTKAKILYIKNDDDNKTFAISFKTTPKNSKGCAHILEHSVLNGSKKYKTKDPFMKMAGSSLQTFLNAMTYPDKTVFPVSSRNENDFKNLTDLYLDSVFNPAVLEKKEIFLQEGWHIDSKNKNFSGVVYNEMKGALSDSDSIVYNLITKYLYKNSTYEFISGGDPSEIVNLSYDEFKDFYYKFYHPSNSLIYFYGDLDILKYLDYLDKEYLKNYDYKKIESDSSVKENSYDKIIYEDYSLQDESDIENKNYLSYSMLVSDYYNLKDYFTLQILANCLVNSEASVMKKAFNKNNFGQELIATIGYGEKSSLIIIDKNDKVENIDKFVKLVENSFNEVIKNGIDEKLLMSSLNSIDFAFREQINSATKGVELCLTSFITANYGKNPIDALETVKVLDELRKELSTDYFVNFIKEKLIKNKTKLVMVNSPNTKISENRNKDEKEKLEKLLKENKENILKDEKILSDYQNKEDTDEEKNTLKKLDLSEANLKVEKIPREIDDIFVTHNLQTSGICYISFNFENNWIKNEKLKYLSLLINLLTEISTKNSSFENLSTEIDLISGNLDFNVNFIEEKDTKKVKTFVKITTKTLKETLEKLIDLIYDILLNTKFDEKERIKDLIKRIKLYYEYSLNSSGHSSVILRNKSYYSNFSSANEEVSGIEFYKFIREIDENFDEYFDNLKYELEEIYKNIFNKNKLLVNITYDGNSDEVKKIINEKNKLLKNSSLNDYERVFEHKSKKEAFIINSNVCYVSKGANISKFVKEYNGKLILATNILSNPFLYEKIRAKGGAYGAGVNIDKRNNLATYSYRDPHIKNTIESYNKMSDELKNLNLNQRELTDKKISSIGLLNYPLNSYQKGESDFVLYISKRTYEDEQKLNDDILNCKISDLKELSYAFKKAMDENNITVIGNKEKILENKNIFDEIVDFTK